MPLKAFCIEISDNTDACFVSDVLFELGALSVTTTDLHSGTAKEQLIFGEPTQPTDTITSTTPPLQPAIWNHARVVALFPVSTDMESITMTIASDFNLAQTPTLRIHTELFDDKTPEYWVQIFQQQLQPIILGSCAITFPWREPLQGVRNVVLEPGLAFGTGEHATTQLCARWLQQTVRRGDRVLDVGSGSGVLALIAVMSEEGIRAVGLDIDAEAVRVGRENAKKNGVEEMVRFCEKWEEVGSGVYDVIVANILAGILMGMAEVLVRRMGEGGRIGLSGILLEQAEEVCERFREKGVVMENAEVQDGWVLLVGSKM